MKCRLGRRAARRSFGYLESGHVEVLLAQDCYGWGHKSVEILLDKIVKNQDPPAAKIFDPLTEVTKENVEGIREELG